MLSPPVARLVRTLHWTSSAFGLSCLLFFSVTGITLNHPDWFAAETRYHSQELVLESAWLTRFVSQTEQQQLALLTALVDRHWQLPVPRNVDRDDNEWVLDYQRPGGISTVVLDIQGGSVALEKESDGAVAIINDLHKGRHSGAAWSLLIDTAAVLCLVLSITGLLLLIVYARRRASTWWWVLAGSVLPIAVYGVFVP